MSKSLWPHWPQPTRLLCPWDFPTLEWVALFFSRGSSQPGEWTHISYVGRQILLYHWPTLFAFKFTFTKPAGHLLWIYRRAPACHHASEIHRGEITVVGEWAVGRTKMMLWEIKELGKTKGTVGIWKGTRQVKFERRFRERDSDRVGGSTLKGIDAVREEETVREQGRW